ncbi:hypothetical protein KW803_01745 [Candidatus Saccharibacteria bacterium]|nr:hypothetical protein [Candidatus Saccharibacteria bacterium]
MGRTVMLSNGQMMVGLDEHGLVHDFYFPYVGEDNLTNARSLQHLIGIWVDGNFSWLKDPAWQKTIDFEADALISKMSAQRDDLGIRLEFSDFVDSQHTAFCRRIRVINLDDSKHEVRVFMHQVFQISHQGRADTILYVPQGSYLYDYKGRCSLLISAVDGAGQPFDQFSIGNFGIEGKEGTYRDAEDGQLDGNLVEHGSVDSVIRCSLQIEAKSDDYIDYWVVASYSQNDAESIHNQLVHQGLHSRLDQTRAYWRSWLATASGQIEKIGEHHRNMFTKSLMVIKAHVDKRGGIIASGDSSIYNYGRDYYSYVWPRDAALTLLPLISLGFSEEPKRFFEFCHDTIHPKGYMMHKYQPDRSIGSTWHPLIHQHHPELAIQEDETALVIFALAKYHEKFGDKEFLHKMYEPLVKPAANFMSTFFDDQTNLPHASYDLWEERFGTHTYTVVVTKAALEGAAFLAESLDHQDTASQWRKAAARISDALDQLYSDEIAAFRKSQYLKPDGEVDYNNTLDMSSMHAFLEFYPDRMSTENYKKMAETIQQKLLNSSPAGGVVRYEHDNYFLTNQQYLGNPWIICSFWMARYYIKTNQNDKAEELINWCLATATPSGMLAEQVDPQDRKQVGVSPLVWSHVEVVNTLLAFYGAVELV